MERLAKILASLYEVDHGAPHHQALMDLKGILPEKMTYWDRNYGLQQMAEYAHHQVPEILDGGLRVLDVGPGVGWFMEVAKVCGCSVRGVDAPISSRSGEAYCRVNATAGRRVAMRYTGVLDLIAGVSSDPGEWAHWFSLDVVHARGSLDAVFRPFKGPGFGGVLDLFCLGVSQMLRPGGFLHVSHNDDEMAEPILAGLEQSSWLRFQRVNRFVTRHWNDG